MRTVTRADIAEKIYEEVGISRKDCGEILDEVVEEISNCLAKGEDVKLASFGSLILRRKTPRVGRNPKTGVEAEISARTVISFKPSQNLRKAINK
ncbi:MAG: integration host factor subunit alpha [Alphaproteobacteria bacterium]|nr:integration host factor subunit alpha [Alphaproteobacteria bacterium]